MKSSAIGPTLLGMTLNDGLHTPIVVRLYGAVSCETNYQRLRSNGDFHEKSSSWPNSS